MSSIYDRHQELEAGYSELALEFVEIERERDKLKAELAATRKDAERYRWLRDQLWAQSIGNRGLSNVGRYYLPITWPAEPDKRNAGDNMDAVIDAAMQATP